MTRILPSVNMREDVAAPSRLGHYVPTPRSAPVVSAVINPGATMVIASHGSGKSLAAGVGAVVVENALANRGFLLETADKAEMASPGLSDAITRRVAAGRRGRHAVLSGHERDPVRGIAEALGIEATGSVRQLFAAIARLRDVDHVAIVWDEFGRHLEGIVAEGRGRDLATVQELAEAAVRSGSPSVSLTLLLHQNVLAYASTLNQTSRSEWKKVEGRFAQLRFVEDSTQVYDLIASRIASRRPPFRDAGFEPETVARLVLDAGWLSVSGREEALEIAGKAYPLSAAALHVLPGLAARVAQNERTMFSFIEGLDLTGRTGMEEVYLAFSEAFRSDVGPGGLHRRWLEAEGALARTENEIERELVCAAFLLQAGTMGERRKVRRSDVEAAAVCDGHDPSGVRDTFDALIARKLILHRKLNDEVAAWHGADADIAGRLRDERLRLAPGFDLTEFLGRAHPAPFVRPVRHNATTGTCRYMEGVYATGDSLPRVLAGPVRGWGRIVYAVCRNSDELRRARVAALEDHGRQVIVVPDEPVNADSVALEVAALESLKATGRIGDDDPLAVRELDELLSVARSQLAASLHRLVTQRPVAATWHSGGARLQASADLPGNSCVSTLMDSWFPLTPRIANDQMVRTVISRQMNTARTRMVTRLMDRSGEPWLGYAPDDGSPEASIYRTLLARTGLHLTDRSTARFASPDEVGDPGLKAAWETVRDFFVTPGRRPLSDLAGKLSAPPIGMARGVIPVIVLAGYRAFARAAWFRSGGAFVPDVMGFASTRMFDPGEVLYEVEVARQDAGTMDYLDGVIRVFGMTSPGPHEEKTVAASQAIVRWLGTAADGARRSSRMPGNGRALLRLLATASDFPHVLFEGLPALLGGAGPDRLERTIEAAEAARDAVDGLVEGYLRDAVEITCEVLGVGEGAPLERVQAWVACFDVDALARRRDLKLTDQALLRAVRDSSAGRYTAEGLARIMSSVVLQRGVDKWQDDTRDLLRRELREARERIENAALDTDDPGSGIETVILERIDKLERLLAAVRGRKSRSVA